jgi:outer membrane autotransporter protein
MYGSYTLAEHTDLNYQIDFGENKTDAERAINFGGLNRRASADYSGWSAHLGAGIGHLYKLNEAATFTPSVRIDYAALKNRSYTESGADALNLQVSGQTTDQLVIGVDAKFNYQIQQDLILTANIGAGYDTYNRTNSVTAAFAGGGSAFITEGLDPSPWIERGGIGATYKKDNGMEFSGRYDVEARPSNFHNQTVSVKFRMPF